MLLHTEASCDFYLFIFACTAKLHQKHCQLSILCPAVWDTLEELISELEDQKIPLEKKQRGKTAAGTSGQGAAPAPRLGCEEAREL